MRILLNCARIFFIAWAGFNGYLLAASTSLNDTFKAAAQIGMAVFASALLGSIRK